MPSPAISNKFGRILDASLIEDVVRNHVKLWFSTYLAEVERQRGIAACSIERPLSYTTFNTLARPMLEEQLPSIIIVSPGLTDNPLKDGSGQYRAAWSVGIATVITADEQEFANRNCKLYCAAIRAALLQQKIDLGGFRGVTWIEERYDDLPVEQSRSMGVGQNMFAIEFDDVVNWKRGPQPPPPADPCAVPVEDPVVAPPDPDVPGPVVDVVITSADVDVEIP